MYEYFNNYYEAVEDKEKYYNTFIDDFWKSTQPFKKFKTKFGWSCKRLNRDDDSDIFLRTYINNLYGKYYCKDLWTKHAKFPDCTFKQFKNIINIYFKSIFKNYIPCDIYEQKHPVTELKSIYDGWGEDSYAVTYIVHSLKGYMSNRMKKYSSGKYIECKCGVLVLKKTPNSRIKYCKDCAYKSKIDSNKKNRMMKM